MVSSRVTRRPGSSAQLVVDAAKSLAAAGRTMQSLILDDQTTRKRRADIDAANNAAAL
jgi:hypothetical protein